MNTFSIIYLSGLLLCLIAIIIRGVLKLDYFRDLYEIERELIDGQVEQNLFSFGELLLSHFIVWTTSYKLDKEKYKTELLEHAIRSSESIGFLSFSLIIWPVTIVCFLCIVFIRVVFRLITKLLNWMILRFKK